MKAKHLLATAIFSLSATALAYGHGNLADVVAQGDRGQALDMIKAGEDVNASQSDGSTALHYAAHLGDEELVAALIKAGADTAAVNNYGAYALSEATIKDCVDCIRHLLKNGADANQANPEGETALMIAARNGNLEAAKLLVKYDADVNATEHWGGQSPLMWASAQKQPEMMRYLIAQGADIDAKGKARFWDRRTTSEPRPKDMNKGGFSPLHYAARQACIECIKILAEAGADLNTIDPDRVTPLNLALINQNFDAAAALIEAGADVNKWDLYGRTPLYNAIDLNTLPSGGRTDIPSQDELQGIDIARMLLERGANPNIQLKLRPPYRNVPFDRGADEVLSTGATPLMRAARAADNPAVELLLEHGALPNLPNAAGQTPLMIVSGVSWPADPTRGELKTQEGSIETIRLLLAAGADINAISGDPTEANWEHELEGENTDNARRGGGGADASGQTALHGAAKEGWNEIVQYLVDNGAVQQVVDNAGRTPIDLAMGRYPPAFLAAPPEPKPDTVMLLQESCMASDNCQLEEVIDFSNPGTSSL